MALQSIGGILRENHGDLLISKQSRRRAERIELVRRHREDGCSTLGFTSRPFVLCGLPVRRPHPDQLLYERRNGHFILQMTGHPSFGLPFGQDRLVPIFLATLAVRQKSQTIRFRSAAEMLDTFGLAKGGKEYRRLIQAFERVFGATIFFGIDSSRPTARIVHRSRFNFLREARIWYQRGTHPESLPGEAENLIVLSDEFYSEIRQHPIPTDLAAIQALSCTPAALDLFVWMSYRSFSAKKEERIPLFGTSGLTGQLGCAEYSRPRRFRAMLQHWLTQIRALWPNCPCRMSSDGRAILISPNQTQHFHPGKFDGSPPSLGPPI